jgi:hypothetical protein
MSDTQVQVLPISTMPSGPSGPNTATYAERAQDPTVLIENLKLSWRGSEWVPQGDGTSKLIPNEDARLMNETGVAMLSGILRGLISSHILNAAYGPETMNKRLYIFGRTLRILMRCYSRKWDLDEHAVSSVFWQIWLQVDGTYRQALDTKGDGIGPWRETVTKQLSETRNTDNTPAPPKTGVLSSLPFQRRN